MLTRVKRTGKKTKTAIWPSGDREINVNTGRKDLDRNDGVEKGEDMNEHGA